VGQGERDLSKRIHSTREPGARLIMQRHRQAFGRLVRQLHLAGQ
jgi:hypothetical protein